MPSDSNETQAEAAIIDITPPLVDNTETEDIQPTISEKTAPIINKPVKENTSSTNPSGTGFVNWLKTTILKERFPINKSTAKIHLVKDSDEHTNLFLVSPSIFEMYLQESGKVYDQEAITALQYDFQDLGLHKKCIITNKNKQDSVNFWRCSVIGPRKSSRLVGYLIPNTELFFGNKVLLPNQRLKLIEGSSL